MGEQDRGFHADRIKVSYWDALGNETVRYFAANLPDEEIPVTIDCPSSGLPAGRDGRWWERCGVPGDRPRPTPRGGAGPRPG